MASSSFWNKKKVFITGHTGFKGSWLTLFLTSLGAEVIGYSSHPPSIPNLFEQCNVAKECTTTERRYYRLRFFIPYHESA